MKGIYCLLIYLSNNQKISFGYRIADFRKGSYLYIGSALNGLLPRISRHLQEKKKMYWHIDNLLANKYAKIMKIYYLKTEKKLECEVAEALNKILNSIKSFGCSDCRCNSHLFYTLYECNSGYEKILLKEFGFKTLQEYEVNKLVKKQY